jgi:hypothetical protein
VLPFLANNDLDLDLDFIGVIFGSCASVVRLCFRMYVDRAVGDMQVFFNSQMIALESKESIDAANAELKSILDEETKAWVNTNVSQRGKKPKAKTGVCQTLACYCGYSNCFMRTSREVWLCVCNFAQMMLFWGLFKIHMVVRGI